MAVDELHDLGERSLEGAFHRLGKLHRRTRVIRGIFQRSGFLRDVAVGEDHDHRLGFAAGDQVVEDLRGTALGDPGILVAADAVEHVQHGILHLRVVLVAGRGIDGQAAVETGRSRRIPHFRHRAVGHAMDGVEVAARACLRDEEHAGERGDVAVDEHVVVVDHTVAVDNHRVGVHFRFHDKRRRVFPHTALLLGQVGDAGSVIRHLVAVHLKLQFLRRQEVAGDLDLDGLGGAIAERNRSVRIDDRRFHVLASPERLLTESGDGQQERHGDRNNSFHTYFTTISFTGSAGRSTLWTGQLCGLASLKTAVHRMSAAEAPKCTV